MRNKLLVLSGALAMLSGVVAAQDMVAISNRGSDREPVRMQRTWSDEQERSATAASPVTTVISITLRNVSLEEALQEIGRRGNVRVSLGEGVHATARKITYAGTSVTIEQALARILANTGVMYKELPNGELVFTASTQKRARADGVIVGKVVHGKTKQALAGATVTVGDANHVTGEDGRFRISVGEGEQTVHVRAVGFVRQSQRVQVSPGQTVTVEIVLEPSASVLDEVIVTGTVVATERRAIPTPITVITGEELEKRGITRIDQLFRGEVPGVYALEQGTVTYSSLTVGKGIRPEVYSRGASGLFGAATPLKTYVDGVELLDATYLGTLDPQSIERIEIVSGPQAATIYGSGAMGGVMQIFTKRGRGNVRPELTATLRYGMLQNNYSQGITPTHNHGLAIHGGNGPTFSYSGNVSYVYSGQWQPGLYNRQYGGSMGATHVTGNLTVGASYSATGTAQGTWFGQTFNYYGDLASYASGESEMTSTNYAVELRDRRVSTSSSHMASLNLDYRFSPAWQHHVTLGRSQNVLMLKPVAPNFQRSSDTLFLVNRLSGQRMTWNYNTSFVASPSWLSSTLTVGANGSLGEQISVTGAQVNTSSSAIIGQCGTCAPSVSLPLNDRSWGGFGRWQVGIFRKLYTTFGFRMEQNPAYGRNIKFDFTPTNGISYTLEYGAVSAKLMASYGRATRAPVSSYREGRMNTSPNFTPAIYVGQFENPDLRPEYSRGPQGGIELYIGNRGSLTINHYQQKITDLIQMVIVDSVRLQAASYDYWFKQPQYRNTATIRQFGWDGTGSFNAGPVTIKGTYSWADSRILWRDGSVCCYEAPGSFLGLPTHSGNVTVGYAHGGSSITVITNFTGVINLQMRETALYRRYQSARLKMYREVAAADLFYFISRTSGYAKSNVSATHRLSRQLSATLNVINIGNSFTSDVSDLSPSLGRQTTVGLSYRFGNQ